MANRLSRWLARLDAADRATAGIDPEEYARAYSAKRLAEAEALYAVIPKGRRDAVLARAVVGPTYSVPYGKRGLLQPHPITFDCPGLQHLLLGIKTQTWTPRELPAAIVDAMLRWPCLRDTRPCRGCEVPLPYQSGIWTSPKGVEWQAFLLPFTACPGCGLSIRESVDWTWIRDWLPPFVPSAGWTFRCIQDCPHGEILTAEEVAK